MYIHINNKQMVIGRTAGPATDDLFEWIVLHQVWQAVVAWTKHHCDTILQTHPMTLCPMLVIKLYQTVGWPLHLFSYCLCEIFTLSWSDWVCRSRTTSNRFWRRQDWLFDPRCTQNCLWSFLAQGIYTGKIVLPASCPVQPWKKLTASA